MSIAVEHERLILAANRLRRHTVFFVENTSKLCLPLASPSGGLLLMSYARPKPERLAEKLRQIRNTLGLSQTEMLKRLGVEEMIAYHRIS